ncbi:hypothetical protein GW17_00028476 [Ensete ventricosum]|nr:hypothetical protein GW17_00028476 [Ensete ventricosum]
MTSPPLLLVASNEEKNVLSSPFSMTSDEVMRRKGGGRLLLVCDVQRGKVTIYWDCRGRVASDLQVLPFLLPLLPSSSLQPGRSQADTALQRATTVKSIVTNLFRAVTRQKQP